jgi:antitoxin (DNA-binding transcriptional repressor) of toxin-antitoxin stability system
MRKEQDEMIADDQRRSNALAMMLIKKGFKYIRYLFLGALSVVFLAFFLLSVLQGGFAEAAFYIKKAESKLSLATAIIDVDKVNLSSLLDIPYEPPAHPKATISSRLETALSETAPAAMKSVGNFISNWRSGSSSSQPSPPSASANSSSSSAVPPIVNKPDDGSKQSAEAHQSSSSEAPGSTSPQDGITNTETAKKLFTGFSKSIGMFGASSLDSLKKGISAVSANVASNPTTPAQQPLTTEGKRSSSADHPLHDGFGPNDIGDTTGISISKSDQERAQALALHRMSGLKKGDQVTITRAELPGAILFPCTKNKEVWIVPNQKLKEEESTNPTEEDTKSSSLMEEGKDETEQQDQDDEDKKEDKEPQKVKQDILVSRYLAVSRERFMVLDANGGGIGSIATVKSNHHLTEVLLLSISVILEFSFFLILFPFSWRK